MEKVFNTYASRKGVSIESLRFLADGQRCVPPFDLDETWTCDVPSRSPSCPTGRIVWSIQIPAFTGPLSS